MEDNYFVVLVVGLFRSSVSLWYFVSFKEFSLLFKLSKMLFIVPEYPLNVCSVCSDTISPIPVIGNRVFLSFFVHLHRDLHLNQMRKIKSDKNQFYWSFQRVGFLFHWCFFRFFVVVVSCLFILVTWNPCETLVSGPGIKPMPPEVEVWHLNC